MPDQQIQTLSALEGQQLVDFIRETVQRLHNIADYLEEYVAHDLEQPDVGFDTPMNSPGEGDVAIPPPT